jgi:zinc transporter ZupT
MYGDNIPTHILGVSNAIAAGMMLTASGSMSYEAFFLPEDHSQATGLASISPPWRLFMGFIVGILFIMITKKIVEGQGDETAFEQLKGASAKKALLIMAVMFLHSFAEGVGIGVSFGGDAPPHLGLLISATLAVHNIPEGLAISLVLVPKGLGTLQSGLWCVFSSIPQPLMAVPAYLFIESFKPWLPIGLGFAAGAMVYVAFFELLVEAIEESCQKAALTAMGMTIVCMALFQWQLKSLI